MNINKKIRRRDIDSLLFFCLRIKKNKTYSQFPDFGYIALEILENLIYQRI